MRDATPDARQRTSAPSSTRFALLLGLASLALLLLLLPSFASAAVPKHSFKEAFGSAAQPTFANPAGMAVDPATGDLLVIDLEDKTLHRYNPDGTPSEFTATGTNVIDGHAGGEDETPSGEILSSELGVTTEVQVAVAPPGAAGGTAGDIYVTNAFNGVVDIFESTGKYLATQAVSSYPCGVAVDPDGNVFVGSFEGEEGVHKYTPTAPGALTESANSPFASTTPCQVAAGEGFVYAVQYNGPITKIASEGGEEGTTKYTVGNISAGPIAIDPVSGFLFATSPLEASHPFNEYDVSGATESKLIAETPLASEPHGIAVSGATGDIYLTRAGESKVETFAPLFELKVQKTGTGSGTIVSTPAGINCGSECSALLGGGQLVELTATPSGATFDGWSTISGNPGTCTGTTSPCQLTMSAAAELGAAFTAVPPAVTGVSPNSGPLAGGNTVTISGTGLANATEVKFGATTATITENTATQIKATAPSCSVGTVDITATTAVGTSPITAADHYSCVEAPALTAIAPPSGPTAGGATVTITGTNLANASEVKFGTTAATITENTATQIKVTSPPCPAGPLNITIITPGGTSPVVPAGEYTCVEAPTVTSVAPNKGPLGGGITVTITGTNLAGASEVKFGATAGTITENTATQIKVTAPACPVGILDITVITTGGTSATGAGSKYTCLPAPTVTSVAPVKGPTAGGTEVEIVGTNLSAATKVEFGGTVATIKSNTATKILATAPPHAAGQVDVIVTTAGGPSAVVSADHFTYVAPLALTVTKAGTGSGSVTCDGGACAASYPLGAKVTLAAAAASGSSFAGWSGGGCSGTGGCTITVEADTAVTATFTANPVVTSPPPPAPTPPPAETKCVVPKLAKKSLSQAKSALKAAHCALGKVTKPKKAKGALVVKSTSPGPGKSLAAGSKVNLKLGPKPKKK